MLCAVKSGMLGTTEGLVVTDPVSRPQTDFAHPYVAVDLVTLTADEQGLRLLVVKRDEAPSGWALPGMFVQMREDVADTASRVGRDKLGLEQIPELIALRPFGTPQRDPRRRVIALPHLALLPASQAPMPPDLAPHHAAWAHLRADEDGTDLTIDTAPISLVFDHDAIVTEAVNELRRRVQLDDPVVYRLLLPERFTLRHLQTVHEALIGHPVNRDSFRRRILMSGRLDQTKHRETNVEHRPASLYQWRDHR